VAIHSRVGTVTNSNTHVPIQAYKDQWESLLGGELMGDGTFANAGLPFLGMQLLEVGDELQVIRVEQESKAEEMGITVGDVFLSLNGMPLSTGHALVDELKKLKVTEEGVNLSLLFRRGEEIVKVRYHYNE